MMFVIYVWGLVPGFTPLFHFDFISESFRYQIRCHCRLYRWLLNLVYFYQLCAYSIAFKCSYLHQNIDSMNNFIGLYGYFFFRIEPWICFRTAKHLVRKFKKLVSLHENWLLLVVWKLKESFHHFFLVNFTNLWSNQTMVRCVNQKDNIGLCMVSTLCFILFIN